jgi:2-polyprenyl-6-hydroxyphenyl methylase/3-demethylubiquinone-9 3-methyltransferase
MTTADANDFHFAFGDNWAAYSRLIDEQKISRAIEGMTRLVSADRLHGSRFLDIGCGSGLHALAAARLGVSEIVAIDIDPQSVTTTKNTLARFNAACPFRVETKSILDVTSDTYGAFDVVYSWGVLHHTGNLAAALKRASALVAPGGLFVFALYRRTYLDWFWRIEKRWYARAKPRSQKIAARIYDIGFRVACRAVGKSLSDMARGMDYWHDVHDWLGGYPYESILSDEVEAALSREGLARIKEFSRAKELGLFGSGCDEYVYART